MLLAEADNHGPVAPDLAFVATCLRPYLEDLLAAEQVLWKRLGAPWSDPLEQLAAFGHGGKALRPRFCFWGYLATGETPMSADLLPACAALELLHTFALIHDDLMDASTTRRGRPSVHQRFANQHERQGWAGSSSDYGTAAGLLTGDLVYALANRLAANLPAAARHIWNELVAELTIGQYLDLAGAARGDHSMHLASTVARLKSARYTVTRPLQLGAALATGEGLDPALARFGDLVGEAFQLRDDLLGVFGDPEVTGKPVGEDLRSGKPTLLVAYAIRHAAPADRALLAHVGTSDLTEARIVAIAAALEACGAKERVERRIAGNLQRAQALLDQAATPGTVCDGLRALARSATYRSC